MEISQQNQAEIDALISQVQKTFIQECTNAFEHIIQKYSEENIYLLSVNFTDNGGANLLPIFSSEKGLEEAYEEELSFSPLPKEIAKKMIKWDLNTNPYLHSYEMGEELKEFMQKTDELLLSLIKKVESSIQELSTPNEDNPYNFFSDEQLAIHIQYLSVINNALADTLNEVSKTPVIQSFLETKNCAIGLYNSYDDLETIILKLKKTNSTERMANIEKDYSEMEEIYNLQEELYENQTESENISLSIEDFKNEIEAWQPEFIIDGDFIYLKKDPQNYGTKENPVIDSHTESLANKIKPLDLLKNSPHYDEVYQLQLQQSSLPFDRNTLLPQIFMEFREKLFVAIETQFPDKHMFVFMIMEDVMSHYITFFQQREDNFSEEIKNSGSGYGFKEIALLTP